MLVYGRRRVGKSELIKQALAKASGGVTVYYECRQTSEADNLASLSALVAEALGYPPLAFSGIRELVEFLFSQAKDKDITFVLDEYLLPPRCRQGPGQHPPDLDRRPQG